MSYENYRCWLRGLKDSELNEEIKKVGKNVANPASKEAGTAWGRLLDLATWEQKRRDEDHGHLLRGTNA